MCRFGCVAFGGCRRGRSNNDRRGAEQAGKICGVTVYGVGAVVRGKELIPLLRLFVTWPTFVYHGWLDYYYLSTTKLNDRLYSL